MATQHFTAWQAYTGSVYQWLEGLLANKQVDANDTVWCSDAGDYAVSGWPGEDFDNSGTEYSDCGTVEEFLAQTEA